MNFIFQVICLFNIAPSHHYFVPFNRDDCPFRIEFCDTIKVRTVIQKYISLRQIAFLVNHTYGQLYFSAVFVCRIFYMIYATCLFTTRSESKKINWLLLINQLLRHLYNQRRIFHFIDFKEVV